jgi:hypothetical protein
MQLFRSLHPIFASESAPGSTARRRALHELRRRLGSQLAERLRAAERSGPPRTVAAPHPWWTQLNREDLDASGSAGI